MELIVFYVAAVGALASAIAAVVHKNPVVNVLSLVVTFFCIAVNFALLGAGFLAAAQILVYAGAILVLFLFVVMLLNVGGDAPSPIRRPVQIGLGLALSIALGAGAVVLALAHSGGRTWRSVDGSGHAIGRLLVGSHLLAFELISVVLLAALVGALVVVRRKE